MFALAAICALIGTLGLSDMPSEEQGLTANYNNNSDNSFMFEAAEKDMTPPVPDWAQQ